MELLIALAAADEVAIVVVLGRLAKRTLEAYSLRCRLKTEARAGSGAPDCDSWVHCTRHFL